MKIKILIVFLTLFLVTILPTACNRENTSVTKNSTTIVSTETTDTIDPLAPPSTEELARNNFVLPEIPRILCEKLKQMMDESEIFTLIDARTNADYKLGHIPGAVNIPNDDPSPFYTQEWVNDQLDSLPQNEMVIFYCD